MRSKVRAAAFFVGFLTFLVCASVYLRLFRYVSTSTAAAADYSATLRRHPHLHLTIDDDRAPSAASSLHLHPSAAVLLPDWQALLLLPPDSPPPTSTSPLLCLFSDNSTSSATPAGILPFSLRHSFLCPLPPSVRRHRPFLTPRLLPSSDPILEPLDPSPELMRWTSIAYESLSTPDDVIVFAKGVNSRQGVNRRPSDLLCLFSDGSTTAVTTSAQEVFRCPHPSPTPLPDRTVQVSLKILSENRVIPSVASYRRRPLARADSSPPPPQKSLLCACTMVYNVAKFLPEWITYHASIGVDRFILYDNMSDDDLKGVVDKLKRENHNNITTYRWPWPKTQEAGFSHCLTLHRDTCHWIAFIDVDEFLFSPAWANSPRPSKSMLGSTLARQGPSIGQVTFGCDEFGPSDLKAHPMDGVTQGYTCRRRAEQRHKSIVRPGAVDLSLVNVVHHFKVREGVYKVRRLGRHEGVVKHYKYQAWPEFKAKFRRRVSAYVVDWTQTVNKGSKDRAPGLGFAPVEPAGWARMFCEVNDTGLRDVTRRWFRVGSGRLAWEL